VYAATRRQTEQWAELLAGKSWNVAAYHAGMPAEDRSRVAARFADRSLDLVVATNAFGMGIDRPDIRAVVHVQPPSSIEAYYQEVGRAGRDAAEAWGLLLCSGADIGLRRRLVTSGADGSPAAPAAAARAWSLFRDLLRYLDARTCRHDFILRYFGDEQELLGGCGHCDICASLEGTSAAPVDDERTATMVRMALSAVARARGRAGLVAIAEMLRGVDDERTRRFGFTALSTFGLLREHDQAWVMDLLRALLAAGWIDLTPTDHPVPQLTTQGDGVMRGKGPVRFVLPLASRDPGRRSAAKRERTRAPGSASPGVESLDAPSRERFERLRAHRAQVARDRGVPPYVVALDRTLVEMATRPPRSQSDLLAVFGMGPARVESYGDGFLAVLGAERR
jgi:ATP-dependent DNA helicase RecQ